MVPSAMQVPVDSGAWIRARTAHWWLEVEVGTVLGVREGSLQTRPPAVELAWGGGGDGLY